VAPYTGEQSPAERNALLSAFVGGSVRVVFATTAFGMGVDKADVRAPPLRLHLCRRLPKN